MKKRNLILLALLITTVLVFTQVGTLAKPTTCEIIPATVCPACPIYSGATCHAGGLGCDAPYYWDCCNWARGTCEPDDIGDRTQCGACCQ